MGTTTEQQTVRFVHTSDWQLGMRRWFFSAEAQARFDAARIAAVRRLGQVAREHRCAFIVVAGDVFEHNSLEKQTLGRAIEELKALPVPVFLLPGNHDPLTADNVFARTKSADNVTVLEDSTPVRVAVGEAPGEAHVEIVGAPWLSKNVSTDLASAAIEPLEPSDAIRIVVAHGQVEKRGNDFAPELIDLKNMEAAYAQRRIDYVALGDTHSAQQVGGSGAVWFSGAPETTDYHERGTGGGASSGGENNSGHALVVEVTKRAGVDAPSIISVQEVPVGTWTFDAVEWDINTAEDCAAFVEFLRAYPNKAETAIKYALRGTVDMQVMQQLEAALGELQPVFAALYERTRLMDLSLAPSDDDLLHCELSGFAASAFTELAELTEPASQDALRLLFRLSREG